MFKLVYVNSLSSNITVLDMNAENMTCINFDTLNQIKSLEEIRFTFGNMSYFPDKDCNNPEHEEDPRPLDLPNLRKIVLQFIELKEVPNTSLMPKLEVFFLSINSIKEIPGTPFRNNVNLRSIGFYDIDLTSVPNLTGGCNRLDKLNLNGNLISNIPKEYFKGCSIKTSAMKNNKLTSFPNFALLGNTIEEIKIDGNLISGMITNDMVKDLPNLRLFYIYDNKLQGFDASFCNGHQPIQIKAYQNIDLKIFENPYRLCIHLLETFITKPTIDLSSTNIPCDHHRCWMKKYASKFTIQINDCTDGRVWGSVHEMDVCRQG